jgi:hypothetical protein
MLTGAAVNKSKNKKIGFSNIVLMPIHTIEHYDYANWERYVPSFKKFTIRLFTNLNTQVTRR